MTNPNNTQYFDVFVACSFSSKVDYNSGEVYPEFRMYIEELLKRVRGLGLTAFCAVEDEGWKLGDEPPELGFEVDVNALAVSDRLLAVVGKEKSEGVAGEVFHSAMIGKKTFFLLEPDVEKLGWWYQGIVNSGRAQLISDVSELAI